MNEVVIFCESYPQIENTLYLATQNYQNQPVTVVTTGYHDLFEFFKVMNEKAFENGINIVYFEIYPARMAQACSRIIKALYLLPDIVRERRYLQSIYNKYFTQLTGADIYFSGRCFNPHTFFLLKKLSKANRIIYMPDPSFDVVQILNSTPRNIFELAIWLRFKMAYGWDLMITQFPYQRCIPTIPDGFFKEHVDRVIEREERKMMLQGFDKSRFRVFNEGNYRVMYFHQDIFEAGYISDGESFQKTITGVFDILSKYFPADSIALKYHPNSQHKKDLIKIGVTLPDFIPAEFLYDERIELYLGFYSMALANVTRGLAVSLMDMVTFRDEETREQLKKELLQWSKKEILFPKSLAEFEKILIDINKTSEENEIKEVI